MMENILLSNLEFERDIVIYNSDDLNIKTENQSTLPVQVLYILQSSVNGSVLTVLYVFRF